MNEKHYKEKLLAFVNHELANDEPQIIGEHLLLCADCRAEHDLIKRGAALANRLKQTSAPENLWNKIENALDAEVEKTRAFALPNFLFSASRRLTTAAAGLLVVCGLFAAIYFGFLQNNSPEIVKNEALKTKIETPPTVTSPNGFSVNQNTNAPIQKTETNTIIQRRQNINSKARRNLHIANSNAGISPKIAPIQPKEIFPTQKNSTSKNLTSWKVETIAGVPKIGNSLKNEELTVGELLETDANSRARVQVANIGNVEIAPNSRVKLVNAESTEYRLALEKGELKARIFAPPRLFIVDTPSAVAVDLGCEYTLEVDENGDGKLHVTGGFVALENGRHEVVVPAGAIALTKKGIGIGTPFAEDSSAEFKDALFKFDFDDGGNDALQTIIKESNFYDSITLWHLLSRVPENERRRIFEVLANFVKPPARTTREGILRLDKKMLDAWWKEIENAWFG